MVRVMVDMVGGHGRRKRRREGGWKGLFDSLAAGYLPHLMYLTSLLIHHDIVKARIAELQPRQERAHRTHDFVE